MYYSDKIYVAGHSGMVGSALVRRLQKEGYTNIITRTSAELDLRSQQAVAAFFEGIRSVYDVYAGSELTQV